MILLSVVATDQFFLYILIFYRITRHFCLLSFEIDIYLCDVQPKICQKELEVFPEAVGVS